MITPTACPPDYWSSIIIILIMSRTHYRLRDALDELAPWNNIKMKLTVDGSSIGATFAAAMNYVSLPPNLTPR